MDFKKNKIKCTELKYIVSEIKSPVDGLNCHLVTT